MRRILVFNDSLDMGGSEKVLVKLLNYLADVKKIETCLLMPEPNDASPLLGELSENVNIRYLRTGSGRFRRVLEENVMIFYPRLYRFLKGLDFEEYETVICFKETFYARLFSKLRTKRILWIHTMLYKRKYKVDSTLESLSVRLNKRHIKQASREYRKYNKVICVSEACANTYREIVLRGRKQNLTVLYNAIDPKEVQERATEQKIEMDKSVLNIVHITRDSPDKRFDRVVAAARILQLAGYKLHIYVIGDIAQSIETLFQYSDQSLNRYFSFVGQLSNPYPYILEADWLLCSSERESFSLSVIEALALNTPVISTDCGGPTEILDGGEYGVLVENSSEGVLAGLKQVLDNPSLLEKYKKQTDEAFARFDNNRWYEMADRILELD